MNKLHEIYRRRSLFVPESSDFAESLLSCRNSVENDEHKRIHQCDYNHRIEKQRIILGIAVCRKIDKENQRENEDKHHAGCIGIIPGSRCLKIRINDAEQ